MNKKIGFSGNIEFLKKLQIIKSKIEKKIGSNT
jgi:hypothetical protein